MKNVLKIFGWIIAMMLIMAGIIYGFWLVLLFLLFEKTAFMVLAIAGEIVLFTIYWMLIRAASR